MQNHSRKIDAIFKKTAVSEGLQGGSKHTFLTLSVSDSEILWRYMLIQDKRTHEHKATLSPL